MRNAITCQMLHAPISANQVTTHVAFIVADTGMAFPGRRWSISGTLLPHDMNARPGGFAPASIVRDPVTHGRHGVHGEQPRAGAATVVLWIAGTLWHASSGQN